MVQLLQWTTNGLFVSQIYSRSSYVKITFAGIGDLIADDRTMMIINDIMNKAKDDVKKLIEKVQVSH